MEDTLIMNARCVKCGKTNLDGVLIIRLAGIWVCGECYHKKNMEIVEQERKKWLEE